MIDLQTSPDDYVERASERMRADGRTVTPVAFADARGYVGYESKFRLRWMATKLHLFTFVVSVPVATPEVLTSLTEWAAAYAKRERGATRSNMGVAVALALVASDVHPQARNLIESGSNPSLSYMVAHALGGDVLVDRVIVDPVSGNVCAETDLLGWGAMFRPWVRDQLWAALPRVRWPRR